VKLDPKKKDFQSEKINLLYEWVYYESLKNSQRKIFLSFKKNEFYNSKTIANRKDFY